MVDADDRLNGRWAAVAAAAGMLLVALGTAAVVAPATAAGLFGLPTGAGPGAAFVSVAGVRDVAAGALVVAFAALRRRVAVGVTVLVGAVIPIGDGLTVLRYGPRPAAFMAMHWGSAVACIAIAVAVLRGRTRS